MKRIFVSILLATSLLLTSGCYRDIYERLDDLNERVENLQAMCDQLNKDLKSLRDLVSVLESQDMITGITQIQSGSETGYRINFVEHEPITIINGKNGSIPLVSSQKNPDDNKYYWAVQYGDGQWDWLRAEDGSMMLSVGILPYVTIRNGMFCYTIDGKTYIELGKANGENGDQMFKNIDTRNEDYVIFTLINGQQLKIPTYNAYQNLKDAFDAANDNALTQLELVQSTMEKLCFISSVTPIRSGSDTTGLTVTLSNGKSFKIHDWTAKMSPAIFIKKHTDGKFYWAYTIGDDPEKWVLSEEGEKIPASSESVEVPTVSVTRDNDGEYYWTVTVGGKTEFLRYPVGKDWTPKAVDSVSRAFHSVTNYSDSLVVVLKDGKTRFSLPKQNTVSITTSAGKAVGESISLSAGGQVTLNYVASGYDFVLSVIQQGGLTVTYDSSTITIKAPNPFPSSGGKIMALFTFDPKTSPVTVVKTITVKKK